MGYDDGLTLAATGSSTTSARPRAARTSLAFTSDVLTAPVKISGRAGRQPGRLDERHRLRLGRQADRRLSRRGRRRSRRWAATSSWSRPTSSAAATARASRRRSRSPPDKPLLVPVRAADGEPRLPAGPPDHGAGPVELVPALRPQPADVRAEHLLGEARGLPEGDAADLSHARPGQLRRAAGRQQVGEGVSGDAVRP